MSLAFIAELVIELLFELLVGPLLELLFEAVIWLVGKLLGVFGKTLRSIRRARYIVEFVMIGISAVMGFAWARHVASTGQTDPPAALWSLVATAAVATIVGLSTPREPAPTAGRSLELDETKNGYLAFTRTRWLNLATLSAVGAAGLVVGFLL